MTAKTDAEKRTGFLARLRKDQSGNTVAIFAAALFPMAGLVGGAVDMARLYSVKNRLQAGCDAGSLASRKIMGNGRWDVNNDGNRNNDATYLGGLQMFDFNFENGYLGSENRTRNFVEANGTVTGTASADVPMTLMRILGEEERTVTVTCTSQMKIPHTDVMFVFDVTGSMSSAIPGDPTGLTKINGLKRATKCFYEALARQNIDDVTPAECYKTANPIGDLSTLTQLRFGFVPFDEQVNIGNILQNGYYKDTQTFQSREAQLENVWTWTLGTASATTGWLNNWTPASPPSSPYNTRQSTSGWTDITSGSVTTLQGSKSFRQTSATNSTSCNNFNDLSGSGNTLTGLTESGGSTTTTALGTTNNPPVYPATEQVTSYQQTQPFTVTQYRYVWESRSGTTSCFLERRAHTTTYTKTQTGGTSSRPITWVQRQRITGWVYKPVTFDVSSLKAGGGDNASTAYNASITLPLNEANQTVNLSGNSSSSTIKVISNATVAWSGCIEERQTVRNEDGDPSDEFSPIPDEAFDLDIDMIPDTGDEATRWGFQLSNAVWGRHNWVVFDAGGSTYYEPVLSDVWRASTSTSNPSGMSRNTSPGCPAAMARKLASYRDATGATNYKNYVNALTPGGNTYHDIGLIWGARLMSPTGIFADENATTPDGQEIQRHMIFMTDGETYNVGSNYTPYGIEGWDRRRTPLGTNPTIADLNAATDARTTALCTAIKNLGNNGVTLWVVYYGTTDVATTTRMQNCATTSNNHFFQASNTQLLIESFNKIAESISELKLTG
ncbi:TadE/TadG family type IV pilus assembly protein [Sphingorhabdus contaminans]|uniref:TadE/TadG family type IV pilus assembly protein n=1 Tax=Sphingorhabdus contaminans TaxID=1343899 RepID=UPI003D2D263E